MEKLELYYSILTSFDKIDDDIIITNQKEVVITLHDKINNVMIDIFNNKKYNFYSSLDYNLIYQEYITEYKPLTRSMLTHKERKKRLRVLKSCLEYNGINFQKQLKK